MNHVSAGTLALVLALGGCVSAGTQNTPEPGSQWQNAAAVRTRADHLEIAAWYEREAAAASRRADVHRKLRDSYGSSSGLYDLTGMLGHCTNLVNQNTQAAKDNAALAELHRRNAALAKE